VELMPFGPLLVRFDARVLRPRPWTLEQSRWAAELLSSAPPGPVLELCAGVGHIGLAVAAESDRAFHLVDADAHACSHARWNAEAAGLAARVTVHHGPMHEAVPPDERFALVLADPPWVPSSEVSRFPADPRRAIDGGPDGLDLARTCVEVVARHLLPGGASVLQLGDEAQADAMRRHLRSRPDLGLAVVAVRPVPEATGILLHLAAEARQVRPGEGRGFVPAEEGRAGGQA
jgi:release factor glutamine methyltransferase